MSNMRWPGLVGGAILLGGQGLWCVLAASAPSAAAGDADNANPYAVIVDRNPFRLNPPPPPQLATPPPALELPEVIFSGTMINAGQMKAMFAVRSKAPKDPKAIQAGGAQDTTSYICLKENETEGPVQLLKIMKGGDEVEIMNSGTRMVLNMKDNGFAKEQASPARGTGPPGLQQGARGNPNLNMQAGQPGQPAAQNTESRGIYVGGAAAGMTGRGGINVAGPNVGNPGGGTVIGGAPQVMNQPGIAQLASSGGYNGGTMVGGATRTVNPVTTTAPTAMNVNPFNSPGNLGSQSSLPPNSTPISTGPLRNVQFPPMPGQPGQQGQKD